MIVNRQKPLIFINNCGVTYETWQLEMAMLWYEQIKPFCQRKTIFMYGRYPAISIHGTKIHIHRLIMSWYLKRHLRKDEYVHHKDDNPLNALLSNFGIQTPAKHQGRINRGKKQTQAHINKRIDATTKTRYGHSIYENPDLLNK